MQLNELKKLIQRLGGMLVMDGERPDFVMLSYSNYKELEKQGETEIAVHPVKSGEAGSPTGLFDGVNHHPDTYNGENSASDAAGDVEDEAKIKQLNEEVAMLRQEIKQREMEEMLPTDNNINE